PAACDLKLRLKSIVAVWPGGPPPVVSCRCNVAPEVSNLVGLPASTVRTDLSAAEFNRLKLLSAGFQRTVRSEPSSSTRRRSTEVRCRQPTGWVQVRLRLTGSPTPTTEFSGLSAAVPVSLDNMMPASSFRIVQRPVPFTITALMLGLESCARNDSLNSCDRSPITGTVMDTEVWLGGMGILT